MTRTPSISSRGRAAAADREHPFGTDELGRDGFSRALFGARISLAVGFMATVVAVSLGVLVGATAGMAGGWSIRS